MYPLGYRCRLHYYLITFLFSLSFFVSVYLVITIYGQIGAFLKVEVRPRTRTPPPKTNDTPVYRTSLPIGEKVISKKMKQKYILRNKHISFDIS